MRDKGTVLKRSASASTLVGLLGVVVLLGGCHKVQPSGPAFDIAALVGQPYTTGKAALGVPVTSPAPSDGTGQATFHHGDYTLAVEYRVASGRVRSVTLTPSESVKDEAKDDLLHAGNLKEGDAHYTVDYVEDPNTIGRTAAVRVTVSLQSHAVTLRVTSTQNQDTEVTYTAPSSILDPTQPGKPFDTVPPWYGSTTAPSETVFSLQAVPIRSFPNPNDDTTVQIEVDGKVAAQGKFLNGRANCSLELG